MIFKHSLGLGQIAAANVTLPHIVGATMRISGIQDYISLFERVFSALGIQAKPEKLPRSTYGNGGTTATLEAPETLYEIIDRMFDAETATTPEAAQAGYKIDLDDK